MNGNLRRSVSGLFLGLLMMAWLSGCAGVPASMPASEDRSTGAPTASAERNGTWDARARDSRRYDAPEADGMAIEEAGGEETAMSASEAWTGRDDADMEMGPALGDAPSRSVPPRNHQQEPVTAGVVDDNDAWRDYLHYRENHSYVRANDVDVSERYRIQVLDSRRMPVHDATVEIYLDKEKVFEGRTDAGGQMLFHPRMFASQQHPHKHPQNQYNDFRVVASKGYVAASQRFPRYDSERWTLQLDEAMHPNSTQLDLLFLVDATGSMGDEIAKLKASMAEVADQIDMLPESPDVRYGLVSYRDLEDAYVVREVDFTHDLDRFQKSLARVRADGGGDEPESLNEALNSAIHTMSWRSKDTVRLVVLVADAPPHLDYHWQPFSYETDMIEAVRRGIKLFPVGASGLSVDGEYIFRQLAQFTGGKFVFLTYEDGNDPSSGPGTETPHDVDTYSVNTLDRLIVRLVREELAQLSQPVVHQQSAQVQSPLAISPSQPDLLAPSTFSISSR